MAVKQLTVRGVRVNNLKNVSLSIPRDSLTVLTGVSGSGKSSMAFDTIYAEGHRRFVESLTSYARQFLGQLDKPDLDAIEGLSPAIAIDQKTTSRNPRSTVGTVTEIYDYLRLLYARVGVPHCPVCGREIQVQTVDQIVDQIMAFPEGTKLLLLSPVVAGKKGEHRKVFEDIRKAGFVRVRVDGELTELDELPALDKNKKHHIDIVVDRLVVRADLHTRLTDSVETALKFSQGNLSVQIVGGEEHHFSQNYACAEHGVSLGELEPRMFSFNNPYGACPSCDGLGVCMVPDPDLIVPDKSLSIRQGAIRLMGWKDTSDGGWRIAMLEALGEKHGFSVDTPFEKLSEHAVEVLFRGTGLDKLTVVRKTPHSEQKVTTTYEGIFEYMERFRRSTSSEYVRADVESFMRAVPCKECHGARLKRESLAVTVGGKNIHQVCCLPIDEMGRFFEELTLSEKDAAIAKEILKEIRQRVGFLTSVGLSYLTLSRASGSLSGGESQRIRLATQIGSALTGVLYILDEPSIGLHQRDNARLIRTLQQLRDAGNTVVVVEHDEDTIRAADYVADFGPGAGVHGGEVVACGTPEEVARNTHSLTGDYLSGRRRIDVPTQRRRGNGSFLRVRGAEENNLKKIDVDVPLGCFVAVTGVSGSGKSSLVNSVLLATLQRKLNGATVVTPGKCENITGLEALDKVISIDQTPIGRTPRSNPATYTGLFTDIRNLFAQTNEARARGYQSNRFSFNVKGGRCEACEGDGILKIEMHFLPDVYVPCDVCHGRRYNRETLEIRYRGKNIHDVLEMTVEEGLHFFENHPRIRNKLQTLYDVGLGYIKIGQPSTTLSGGEAQRVKLAAELARRSTGRTVYVLDEPTTGLHSHDVANLLKVLQRFVKTGNTVLVIEHNLDVIKCADYLIDLGPEGGDGGGTVVACGTPEEVALCEASYTGQYLRQMLKQG